MGKKQQLTINRSVKVASADQLCSTLTAAAGLPVLASIAASNPRSAPQRTSDKATSLAAATCSANSPCAPPPATATAISALTRSWYSATRNKAVLFQLCLTLSIHWSIIYHKSGSYIY